jgi:hypothetical protein
MKLNSIFSILVILGVAIASTVSAQTVTDSSGFMWDIQANGSILDGSSDTFDSAFLLYANSNSFDGSAPAEKKGVYTYGPSDMGGIQVSRDIMLSTDPGGIVVVDSFKNTGGAAVNVTPMNYSDMGETATPQQLMTKRGTMQAFVYPQMNGRSSVTAIFGESNTKYLPTMSVSGDELTINFPQFKLPAGQTRSIGYFIAQRPTGSQAELRDDKKAFSKAMRQISSKKRFNFLNLSGMNIFSVGDIELVAQGETDYLETLGGDKVYGTLTTKEFVLETSLGQRKLTTEQIVNVIGMENGRKFQVIANDGSALTGKLEPSSVQFALTDGGSGQIALDEIQRLVPKLPEALASKDPKERAKWFKFDQPLFVFKNDDRIAGELLSKEIVIHTSIGEIAIPIETLRSIELNNDNGALNTASFTTKDGQVFTGVFYEEMKVKVWTSKTIDVSPGSLKTIYLQGGSQEEASGEVPSDKSLLKLSESEFLFATIKSDKKPLVFETAFGKRTIDPEQISSLENVPGISGEMKIVLWDGSSLTGRLGEEKILFDVLGRDMELLPSMVSNFTNPNAVPPESLRQKFVDLIKQLDSPKFEDREAAFAKLEKDAEKIKGLLETHLKKAETAESRARLLKLLGREQEDEKPKKEGEEEATEGEADGEEEAAGEAVEEAAGAEADGGLDPFAEYGPEAKADIEGISGAIRKLTIVKGAKLKLKIDP